MKQKNKYIQQDNDKTQRVERVQYEKKLNHHKKHTDKIMNRTEKEENVNRKQRLDEFKREQLQSKIEQDNLRTLQIQAQKEQIAKNKFKIAQDVEKSKREMMEKFQKVKEGKLTVDQLFPNSSVQASLQNHTLKQNKSVQQQEISPKKAVPNKKKPVQNTSTQAKKQQKIENDVNNKRTEQALFKLRFTQNKEMLDLLDKEQNNEFERDKLLEECKESIERKRLEKIFGVERAKVQQSIVDLSAKHEKQIQQIRNQYN